MTINRNNYEPFVIDYLDGALSPEMTAELLLFLELNPDIASEVEGLQNEPIPSEDFMLFDKKDSLRKPENAERADELMFLVTEGLAGAAELAEWNLLLASTPSLNKEWEAMQKARWVAEPMSFDNKKALYKSEEDLALTGDMRLAALLEGDLNAKESAALHKEIAADKNLAASWTTMQKTKLQPVVIPFEAKDSLYHKQARVITLRRAFYFAAAACALLFVALFWNNNETVSTVASNDKKQVPAVNTPKENIEPGQSVPTPEKTPVQEEPVQQDPSLAYTPKQGSKPGRTENNLPNESEKQEVQVPDNNEGYADNSGKINRLKTKNPAYLKGSRTTGEVLPTKSLVAELPLPENLAQVPTAPAETFPTILQFAGEKAKEKILGDEPLEEATAYHLVEKGLNMITGKDNARVERKNRGFHFKLGKFEVERN